jgi:hypothetical protein
MRVTTESPMVTRTEVGDRTFVAKDGIFNMPDEHGRLYLKATGQAALSLAGVRRTRDGYWCEPCRFATYFKKCSKCGGECRREENPDGSSNARKDFPPVVLTGW